MGGKACRRLVLLHRAEPASWHSAAAAHTCAAQALMTGVPGGRARATRVRGAPPPPPPPGPRWGPAPCWRALRARARASQAGHEAREREAKGSTLRVYQILLGLIPSGLGARSSSASIHKWLLGAARGLPWRLQAAGAHHCLARSLQLPRPPRQSRGATFVDSRAGGLDSDPLRTTTEVPALACGAQEVLVA